MQSRQLVEILDRFLEAVKRVDKWRMVEKEAVNLEKAMSKAFAIQAKIVAKTFDASYRSYFQEAAEIDDDPIFTPAEMESVEVMSAALEEAEKSMLETGGKALIATAALETSFDLKNPRAVQYLKEHGADLVAKLNETTRDDMRHVLEYARENGWSYDKTAKAIQERYKGYYDAGSWWNFDSPRPQGHINTRAHLIAVTESGNAYSAGEWMVAKGMIDAGLPMEKRWVAASDERDCEICDGNAAEDWIPAEDAFSSGDDYPLAHPACRCDAQYRRAEDAQKEEPIDPFIGVSPYHSGRWGKLDAVGAMAFADQYGEKAKQNLLDVLDKYGVKDDVTVALGVWDAPEGSLIAVVTGKPSGVRMAAAEFGNLHDQDSVAILWLDKNGKDLRHIWTLEKPLSREETIKLIDDLAGRSPKERLFFTVKKDEQGRMIGLEHWGKESEEKEALNIYLNNMLGNNVNYHGEIGYRLEFINRKNKPNYVDILGENSIKRRGEKLADYE